MDIRTYFSSTRKKDQSNNKPIVESKSRKRTFIESDTDDETERKIENKKTKSSKTVAIKRKQIPKICDSSESENEQKNQSAKKHRSNTSRNSKRSRKSNIPDDPSEDVSPVSKKRPEQKKLEVSVKSKFFKEISASDVFGDQPVERDNTKLREVQSQLKKITKSSQNEIKVENDEDFEAALLQLDEIGSDWVNDCKQKENENEKFDEPAMKEVESPNKNEKLRMKKEKKPDIEEKSQFPMGKKVEESPKKTRENEMKKRRAEEPEKCEISPPKRLSIKDKLRKFSAFENSDKRLSEENSSSEKSFSATLDRLNSSTSGYSSMTGSDSQETVCSALSEVELSTAVNKKANAQTTNEKSKNVKKIGLNSKKTFISSPSVKSDTLNSLTSDYCSMSSNSNSQESTSIVSSKIEPLHIANKKANVDVECSPWVEKYKPDTTKKIIGQQGDKSNVKKLINWLNDWYKNNSGNKKAKFIPSGWNKDQTGASFKAALLSGPPGVGKTTTVSLVCKELGFDTVEFNASDTRSKKHLQEQVAKILENTSLMSHFSGDSKNVSVTKKHVLVMDEVDGMAGTEDRGGIQELIQLIKLTKVPVICMCNDRNHPKIRSLVNYCFDLRFQRPRVEQIKGYMRTVCFKEKLNVSPDVLTNIITSSNNDVRLVLNHLSMLAADKNSGLEASKKYVKLGPWDVLRKVFSKEDHKTMSIHDKCDLFFYDYSIAPLFVQENYLMVKPLNVAPEDKCKKMKLFALAADSISIGDRVDNRIRNLNAWSLLPTQAIFSSYVPGELLEGYCTAQINFPAWLGKNSKRAKIDRLLQEIQIHTRLKISGSKESVNLEYAPYLRNRIIEPLIKYGSDGAKSSLSTLHDYDLMKDDLDSLNEICSWPNKIDPLATIDSKVKAAFTRLYNKNPPVRPYSLTAPIKKNLASDTLEEISGEEEEEEENDKEDAMIITKKKPIKQNDDTVASTSKTKPKLMKESVKKKKKK